jgi:hypothetical protein
MRSVGQTTINKTQQQIKHNNKTKQQNKTKQNNKKNPPGNIQIVQVETQSVCGPCTRKHDKKMT